MATSEWVSHTQPQRCSSYRQECCSRSFSSRSFSSRSRSLIWTTPAEMLGAAVLPPFPSSVLRSFIRCSLCTTSLFICFQELTHCCRPMRSLVFRFFISGVKNLPWCILSYQGLTCAFYTAVSCHSRISPTAACDGALRSLLRILSLAILSLVALPFLMLAAGIVSSD